MDSYKIDTGDDPEPIILDDGNGQLHEITGEGPETFNLKEKTRLSQIIETLNDAFATDFGDEDKLYVAQMANNMMADEDFINKVKHNPQENVAAIFDKIFAKQLAKIFDSNINFYEKITSNEQLREKLKQDLLDYVYEEQGEKI